MSVDWDLRSRRSPCFGSVLTTDNLCVALTPLLRNRVEEEPRTIIVVQGTLGGEQIG